MLLHDFELSHRFWERVANGAKLAHRNPRLFAKKMWKRAQIVRPVGAGRACRRIGPVLFECDFSLGVMARLMYRDAYQIEVGNAMSSVLQEGDTFVDVGAHIGYFSAIGMSVVGPAGTVHRFEPVPAYFQKLQSLAHNNPEFRLVPNDVAVGEQTGTGPIYVGDTSKTNSGMNTPVAPTICSTTSLRPRL